MCEDSRQLKTKAVFISSPQASSSWSEACAQHMTGMQRVMTRWWQLVFANVSRVRSSRKIPTKHFVLLFFHIWYTLSLSTLYIPTLPTYVEECFKRENPNHYPWKWEIVILTILYTIHCGFSSTLTSLFLNPWQVDNPNTYHIHSECQVRCWRYWEALEEAKFWQMQSGVLQDLKS